MRAAKQGEFHDADRYGSSRGRGACCTHCRIAARHRRKARCRRPMSRTGRPRRRRRATRPRARATKSSSPARASATIRSTDAPRVFVDQAGHRRRPASTRSTTCSSACRARAAASTASSTIPATSAIRPTARGVGAGAAEIDLRYLGSARTLVLVDGLRFVNGASASGVPGSVDLNSIPESMIERVEVLQDGASAIYGSDAIAGVVNIITKQHQDGLRRHRRSSADIDKGDGFTQNYQLSWGNGDDGPTAGRRRRQLREAGRRSRSATARFRAFPAPYATTCARCAAARASRRNRPLRSSCFGPRT